MENYYPDISIIVLIHDVSSYIEKCLKSINNQDFDKTYEVLLLMDAATQDDYAAVEPFLRDSKFKQYSLDFHNQGEARNFGLKKARGKYVYIVDGDDYLCSHCLSALYEEAEEKNSDIVIANYYLEKGGKIKKPFNVYRKDKKKKDSERLAKKLFYDKSIRGYTWNKLYRKSFLDKFYLTFLDAHHFVEDYAFNFVALLHTNKVNFINDFVYVYVYHQNSISNKNIASQIDRFIFTFALLKLYCVQNNHKSAAKIHFSQKKIFLFILALLSYKTLKGRFIKTIKASNKAINQIRKNKFEIFKNNEYFHNGYLEYLKTAKD